MDGLIQHGTPVITFTFVVNRRISCTTEYSGTFQALGVGAGRGEAERVVNLALKL